MKRIQLYPEIKKRNTIGSEIQSRYYVTETPLGATIGENDWETTQARHLKGAKRSAKNRQQSEENILSIGKRMETGKIIFISHWIPYSMQLFCPNGEGKVVGTWFDEEDLTNKVGLDFEHYYKVAKTRHI